MIIKNISAILFSAALILSVTVHTGASGTGTYAPEKTETQTKGSPTVAEKEKPVTAREDSLLLPTYVVLPPNPMPRFYEGQAHQGVQRHYYPYPMNDNLTRTRVDKNYHIVYLENEYIRIGIMPGLGGRIFEAVDKTNGYNFFYRQHVIKPSLIGMVGYWISGGNAWGYPHHHGPHTVEPMDYQVENHADGGATVWISHIEKMHRLRVLLGYTVRPGSSTVEMTIRPYNPTPYTCSFLFWANPSVHVDSTYQVIFPPSVEYVTQHHKTEMTSWPVADSRYNRYDYTGKDISLWKNTGVPSSFFSWNPQEDFFGGYDHGKDAGTAWIGNHYTSPGMKYWADGNNPAGRMINDGLTDSDGQYIELMAGAYTDNQPDYSWLQPYESKDVTMTWFPIRNLGGMKEANLNGALNLEASDDGTVSFRVNATHRFPGARITLWYGNQEKFTRTADLSPAAPFSAELRLPAPLVKKEIRLLVTDRDGKSLLEYRPQEPPGLPKPAALTSPPKPEEVQTTEELYLHGLRINQFHNASLDPMPYYSEVLKRDSNDYRVNTQLGLLYAKGKHFEAAESLLLRAAGRITMRYTRPMESEALYYLGVVQRKLNKRKDAYDHLFAASWNGGWHTQSYHQLAEMDCENGDFSTALDHINRALSTNIHHVRGLGLKVIILRKLERPEEAEKLAREILAEDPLDYTARNELALIFRARGMEQEAGSWLADLEKIMAGRVESYLELSTYYASAGCFAEAAEILGRPEKTGEQYPLLYYYLGYYHNRMNNPQRAEVYYSIARTKPHDYCFPFREESAEVLGDALKVHPGDAMALYYLGNLYYEQRPEKAVELWEKALDADNSFYIVWRNLALAAREHGNDLKKSITLYEEAFRRNRSDTRLMFEYDQVLADSGETPASRYDKIFRNNREVSSRHSGTYLREIELLLFLGKYDEVAGIIENTQFVESEGSRTFRDVCQNTYILQSQGKFKTGDVTGAIVDMQKALDFPIGRWGSERRAQMNYLMGTYLEKAGKTEAATASYRAAASEPADRTEYLYEKGLALLKLGEEEKAAEQFRMLSDLAESRGDNDAFRSFEGGSAGAARNAQNAYLKGLALLSRNNPKEARAQFAHALELNPAHLWAHIRLSGN